MDELEITTIKFTGKGPGCSSLSESGALFIDDVVDSGALLYRMQGMAAGRDVQISQISHDDKLEWNSNWDYAKLASPSCNRFSSVAWQAV